MALRVLTKIPKLSLIYFNSDKTTSIIETKKLRDKETQTSFTETVPPKLTTVTLKHNGRVLEAMVIASDGKFLYDSFLAVSFSCHWLKTTNRSSLFGFVSDDEENLNSQEKLFVEDPKNAHLFDVPTPLKPLRSGTKRRAERSSNLGTKKKADNFEENEVRLYFLVKLYWFQ